MDPFKSLPRELIENILQFLDVSECLNVVSLLSKEWYDVVGSSNHCMSKTRLNLRSKRKTDFPERIETIKWMSRKESRKYQHLQINCLLDEENSREVFEFLATLPSAVSINIRSMKFDPDEEVRKIALPKLEELKMMFIPRQAMNSFLTSTSTLKRLILRNEFPLCYDGIDYSPSEVTVHCVKNCIWRNKQLEELELQGRPHFLSFFTDDLTRNVGFKLKKLVVKIEMPIDKVTPELEANFITFLNHQAATLDHVYLDNCGPTLIKHVFNEMPNLTSIRLDVVINDRPDKMLIKDINLELNEKVKHLELPYIVLLEDVKEFLDLTPNVEHLLINHINPRLLGFATKSLPKLQTLTYRHDNCIGTCETTYNDMKIENQDINLGIELLLCNDFL